jgi:hypothetical protein
MYNKGKENREEEDENAEEEEEEEEEEDEEDLDVEMTEEQSSIEQPAREDSQKGKHAVEAFFKIVYHLVFF